MSAQPNGPSPRDGAARRARQRGRAVLEVTAAVLLVGAIWAFVRAVPASDAVVDAEARAVEVLRAIERVQRRAMRESGRPLHLAELPADLFEAEASGAVGRSGVLAGGYRYVVYLAGPAGEAVTEPDRVAVHPSFFVAYAWPERWGIDGRSVYTVDGSGTGVRRWDNAHGLFDGREEVPPAWLAPEPEGARQPLERGPLGFLEDARWRPVPERRP